MSLLVIHANITEQVRHGFSIVDAANGFWQDHADIHRLDLGTLEFLDLVWNGVGDNDLHRKTSQNQYSWQHTRHSQPQINWCYDDLLYGRLLY